MSSQLSSQSVNINNLMGFLVKKSLFGSNSSGLGNNGVRVTPNKYTASSNKQQSEIGSSSRLNNKATIRTKHLSNQQQQIQQLNVFNLLKTKPSQKQINHKRFTQSQVNIDTLSKNGSSKLMHNQNHNTSVKYNPQQRFGATTNYNNKNEKNMKKKNDLEGSFITATKQIDNNPELISTMSARSPKNYNNNSNTPKSSGKGLFSTFTTPPNVKKTISSNNYSSNNRSTHQSANYTSSKIRNKNQQQQPYHSSVSISGQKKFQSARIESLQLLNDLGNKLTNQINHVNSTIQNLNQHLYNILTQQLSSIKQKVYVILQQVFQQAEQKIKQYMKKQQKLLFEEMAQAKKMLEQENQKVNKMKIQMNGDNWRKTTAEILSTIWESGVNQLVEQTGELMIEVKNNWSYNINSREKGSGNVNINRKLDNFQKVLRELVILER